MSTFTILFLYGIGVIIVGITIGYFIDKTTKKNNPRTKEELLDNFMNELEKRTKKNDGNK